MKSPFGPRIWDTPFGTRAGDFKMHDVPDACSDVSIRVDFARRVSASLLTNHP